MPLLAPSLISQIGPSTSYFSAAARRTSSVLRSSGVNGDDRSGAVSGAPIALPIKLQGSGKLYFHSDGKRVLGNFGQPPRLSWVDLETGSLKPVVQSTGSITRGAGFGAACRRRG